MRPFGVVLLGAISCNRAGPSASLLAGKQPARADGVANPLLLTDGRQASDGDDWNAPAAAMLQADRAFVDYDLGKSVPIDAAYLQGDNNDDYVVAVSEDGSNFRELWVAHPVAASGLRGRAADGLGGQGRWIRLSARGGDRAYSVTELQLWSRKPATFPPHREAQASPELRGGQRAHDASSTWCWRSALVLFATREGWRARWTALLWLAPVVAASLTARAIAAAWPLGARELSFARASAAAIVLLALLRGWATRARRAAAQQDCRRRVRVRGAAGVRLLLQHGTAAGLARR